MSFHGICKIKKYWALDMVFLFIVVLIDIATGFSEGAPITKYMNHLFAWYIPLQGIETMVE